jgi:hypothetical protein
MRIWPKGKARGKAIYFWVFRAEELKDQVLKRYRRLDENETKWKRVALICHNLGVSMPVNPKHDSLEVSSGKSNMSKTNSLITFIYHGAILLSFPSYYLCRYPTLFGNILFFGAILFFDAILLSLAPSNSLW